MRVRGKEQITLVEQNVELVGFVDGHVFGTIRCDFNKVE